MPNFIDALAEQANNDFSSCLKIAKDYPLKLRDKLTGAIKDFKNVRFIEIDNFDENSFSIAIVIEQAGQELNYLISLIPTFINSTRGSALVEIGNINSIERTSLLDLTFTKRIFLYTDQLSGVLNGQIIDLFAVQGYKLSIRDNYYFSLAFKGRNEATDIAILEHKSKSVVDSGSYNSILDSISAICNELETKPETTAKLSETDIRDIICASLSERYEATVTGESFNREGKTDILLKWKSQNVFIAECKIWSGVILKSLLDETITQLLKYVGWRDEHTAIIFFYRGTDLTKTISEIPALVAQHPNFVGEAEFQRASNTEFTYLMKNLEDENKKFTLTIQFFKV
jgi:hypothetical protein